MQRVFATTNDPTAVMNGVAEHVSRVDCFDLGGVFFVATEVTSLMNRVLHSHPAATPLPYRDGTLDDSHIAQFEKSALTKGKLKKGDSMRTALSLLYAVIGHDMVHPDI